MQPIEGTSGTTYGTDAGVEGLRRDYDELIIRYGGLEVALKSIASMLDVAAVEAKEGLRPDIAARLLRVAADLAYPRTTPVNERATWRLPPDVIAEICHEANAAYCRTLGDYSQPDWPSAPEWQRESAVSGVVNILLGKVTAPHQSHESWMAQKQADGWTWGPHKDPSLKQHPCMVPYDELPEAQRRKDALFFAIVKALTT